MQKISAKTHSVKLTLCNWSQYFSNFIRHSKSCFLYISSFHHTYIYSYILFIWSLWKIFVIIHIHGKIIFYNIFKYNEVHAPLKWSCWHCTIRRNKIIILKSCMINTISNFGLGVHRLVIFFIAKKICKIKMVDIVPNSQLIIGHGAFSLVYRARLANVSFLLIFLCTINL